MTFAADILGILPALRANAESLMSATCVVKRPTGATVTDPDTWQDVPELENVPSRGICKIQTATPQASYPEDGQVRLTLERLQLHMPIGDPVRDGDLVEILVDSIDPANNGLVFRLTELQRGTYRTAQRWDAELLT